MPFNRFKATFRSAALALLAALSGAALADAQPYSIRAGQDLGSAFSGAILEIHGKDGSYAELGDFGPGAGIGAYLNSWLLPQISPLGQLEILMTYDRQAAPDSVVVTTGSSYSRYNTASSAMDITLMGSGGSLSLTSGATYSTVFHPAAGTSQNVFIATTHDWYSGPVPGNTFALLAPALPEFAADLAALLQHAVYADGSFQDATGLSRMPVRLTAPQAFGFSGVSISLRRDGAPAGTYDTLPINLVEVPSFNRYHFVSLGFTGDFGVRVDAADYVSEADYLAASAWVDANLRRFDYDFVVAYDIFSVSPVPEPAPEALMLLGLVALAIWAARRRARAER